MLAVRYSTKFKKDFKRCIKRGYNMTLLEDIINILKIPQNLSSSCKEHSLSGKYKGYRECHIAPDWLLVYTFRDDELWLDRTGTHSDLFDM